MSNDSKNDIVDRPGFIVAGVAFFISLYIFTSTTNEFWFSLIAAILTGCLVWVSYVMMKWVVLALKK